MIKSDIVYFVSNLNTDQSIEINRASTSKLIVLHKYSLKNPKEGDINLKSGTNVFYYIGIPGNSMYLTFNKIT